MGIPKFFRFISERWPLISQLIDGNQIPEFDNLYLDMNSILHTCTRPKDEDVTKRLSEEEVFSAIFAYIDHLFDTIKPKEVFYMAIDGVAPRAKMNQQRARRFRTAVDAEKNLEKAIKEGTEIPKDEPFDSNSITPGTEFMAKLTRYLKYFIHKKVSTDSRWQNVQIILSGHEVPGEGEHKIMEFIRTKKASKDYNPNLRHCIYGLDADLIMLGLVSHEPHFALLREEVTFGRRQTQPKTVEEQKFYLLHLSLVREYLELEFQDLKETISFDYDFERVLDDFILIMYVIGNDFLPNLPDLHLNKGAFPLLIETFKEALRNLDGYINEFGKINLKRLGSWLDILSKFEVENFEQVEVDLEWFNKQLENISLTGEKKRQRQGKLLIMKQQKKLVGIIKPWLIKTVSVKPNGPVEDEQIPSINLPVDVVENNLDFLKDFAFDTGLIIIHSKNENTYSVKLDIDGIDPHETEEEFNERVNDTRRIIKRYEAAIILDAEGEDVAEERQVIYNEKFENWKDNYYKEKLEFSIKDEDKLRELTENYVEGLQWVLFYYYKGVQSWPWYYRYHYAPRISDIKKGLDVIINLEKGTPFRPFEQLMAVLPARSRQLVPAVYRPLMTEPNSPIIDFYPSDVETDMNGKTAEWEAVVKLSFVDPDRLKDAMKPHNAELTPEEKQRNSFGSDILFTFNPQIDEVYKSPLTGVFTDIENNHCFERGFHLPPVNDSDVITGLCEGVFLGNQALAGFPTLRSIPFENELKAAGLYIFNQPSRSTSMILSHTDIHQGLTVEQFAKRFVGKVVYTKYPYLRESKVVSIQDGEFDYFLVKKEKGYKVTSRPMDPEDVKQYKATKANFIRSFLSTKGIELKDVRALVKVLPVSGLKRTTSGAYVKSYAKEEELYPLELVVENVKNKDERFTERPPVPINEEFPIDSKVIFLGAYAYGGEATVTGYHSTTRLDLSVVKKSIKDEPTIGTSKAALEKRSMQYYPSYEVARMLNLQGLFLSKITSSFLIEGSKGQRIFIGLDLKFEARREKVLGFTRKSERGWEFSSLAIQLITDYRRQFPDVFNAISKLASKKNINVADVFGNKDSKAVDERLKSLADWLKVQKSSFIRVTLESDSLSTKSIQEIENQIELYAVQDDKEEHKKLAGVPRDAVLDPSVSFDKLKAQAFKLGDRVVYVHDSGKVPLFSKGTVIAYQSLGSNVTLQVLFDKPLIGGNKFDGRLRTNRALNVDSSLVLNISNKQYIYHSKASSTKTAKNGAKTSKPTSGGQTASNKATNGDNKKKPVSQKTIKSSEEKKPVQKKDNELLSTLKGGQDQKETSNEKSNKAESKKGNELLSLLKGKKQNGDDSTDNESEAQDNQHHGYNSKNLQAHILHQLNTFPQGSGPAPIPAAFPPGFIPPFPGAIPPPPGAFNPQFPFGGPIPPPQGFAPFPPGVFPAPPPQGQQQFGGSNINPSHQQQESAPSNEKQYSQKPDSRSQRGRGGQRGRGNQSGRGNRGARGGNRGRGNHSNGNSKNNGSAESENKD
ncbi:5'-3' exoribonuclease 1 [Wickerhamomyces ciferrii]|uniref:5'-3' exoribonuclease 1 n=1 Tax=Wickerhamomyces ciferrii (strain ATCC 14091 / BCRC 22168 / CBS 111 / JCM 3599 / NBRC 0793 / NRRL Y-1031 F-60-10) TaxID=1206466 RepID=K0KTQ3_WICCF|nr:5'-3' exoribonuclease 1 [Wickerhamomyces ciferrii]CCH46556.1 5'-3' exoribonuclease 1 [Wickerhamomyces ciferrii]